jgi:PKD repeat protein
VTFTNNSTGYDTPLSYAWDFDNDTVIDSTLPSPSYTYNTPETYSVRLTVTDADGSQSTLMRNNYIVVTAGGGCAGQPVKMEGSGVQYNTLQSAYIAAGEGDVIQARASDSYTEDLSLNQDIAITLRGGYDCTFTSVEGMTVLNGTITIDSGTVTIENIELQ